MKEFKKTMEAKDWADGLNDVLVRHNEQPIDPGLLMGWFANAIMFGYDEGVEQKNWLKERHKLINRINDLEKALGGE